MKQIQKHTRNTTVPVSIVSVVFLKNIRTKTVWTWMEEEQYYDEIANHCYLTQYVIIVDIERRFRNVQGIKKYRFPLFLLCFLKIADKKQSEHRWRKKNKILGNYQVSVLNSIYNIGGYKKEIHKCTRNKMVPVFIVSVLW